MKRFVIGALGALAAAAVASPAVAQGGELHPRAAQEIADQYRAAQASGSVIMNMRPMGEWVNYYENFELSSMTFGGVIAQPAEGRLGPLVLRHRQLPGLRREHHHQSGASLCAGDA